MRHDKSTGIRGSIVWALACCGLLVTAIPQKALALGEPPLAHFDFEKGDFPLVEAQASPIFVDERDYPCVIRAATDFQSDIEKVTGRRPDFIHGNLPGEANVVIIGTIGRNKIIDQLLREGKFDAGGITGKWESFVIRTVEKPMPGVGRGLVIAGSDKRGTVFGIYTLSQQIGVSPWYWWADVPVRHKE